MNCNLVYTSTPNLKSTKGRLIIKELFVSNLPKDITLIKQEEAVTSDIKIESPVVHQDVVKFLEAKKNLNISSIYRTPPKSLTPSTKRLLEVYYLKSTAKKLKIEGRRCIRL